MASLAGKVALITGGTKGIGRSTAKILASRGASIAVSYSSDASAADAFVKELGGEEKTLAIKSDAGDISNNRQLVDAVVKKFGRIDILIPNAGWLPMMDLASTTEEAFDRAYSLNVKGPYFLAQAAVPHMPSGGRIVLISTTQCHASTVTPPYLLYNSTKGAIEQMTRVMAKELAAKGITVNAIAPGPTATELFLRGKPQQVLDMIAGLNPFKKIGEPDDVAEAIVFAAGDQAKWVNGQIIMANGGSA
ncbi:MAG: hypothetical protein M1828_007369 [Chrysothrix sp. TS-e1954]|nr:MAG: hypothetical protein M1828_007369 [Chrysothrix sp. TS-e1954]